MKKILLAGLLFSTFNLLAQQPGKGIAFRNKISWEEIKKKAKEENKFIFVDCYATWCQPCREMDSKIFSNKNIGDFINSEFISVRYQMDTTKADDELTKSKYQDAAYISSTYKPRGYPTFLFFNPDGVLVDRGTGAMDGVPFAVMAAHATSPNKQFYTLVERFKRADLPFESMPGLAKRAEDLDEKSIAAEITANYIDNYLLNLKNSDVLNSTNLQFFLQHTDLVVPGNRLYTFFLNNGDLIDSIMKRPELSASIVNQAIINNKVLPLVEKSRMNGVKLDWISLENNIHDQFREFDAKYLNETKANWYKSIMDWPNYTKFTYLFMKARDLNKVDPVELNNPAWQMFLYSNNTLELEEAVKWSNMASQKMVSSDFLPVILDTQASLLFKLGRKDEAIKLESRADSLIRKKDPSDMGYAKVVEKMKKNERFWINHPDKM